MGLRNDKLYLSHLCKYVSLLSTSPVYLLKLLSLLLFHFGQPLEAIQRRAREDRTSVSWYLSDANPGMAGNYAQAKSAAIVFINSDSGEGGFAVDGNAGDRWAFAFYFLARRLFLDIF